MVAIADGEQTGASQNNGLVWAMYANIVKRQIEPLQTQMATTTCWCETKCKYKWSKSKSIHAHTVGCKYVNKLRIIFGTNLEIVTLIHRRMKRKPRRFATTNKFRTRDDLKTRTMINHMTQWWRNATSKSLKRCNIQSMETTQRPMDRTITTPNRWKQCNVQSMKTTQRPHNERMQRQNYFLHGHIHAKFGNRNRTAKLHHYEIIVWIAINCEAIPPNHKIALKHTPDELTDHMIGTRQRSSFDGKIVATISRVTIFGHFFLSTCLVFPQHLRCVVHNKSFREQKATTHPNTVRHGRPNLWNARIAWNIDFRMVPLAWKLIIVCPFFST